MGARRRIFLAKQNHVAAVRRIAMAIFQNNGVRARKTAFLAFSAFFWAVMVWMFWGAWSPDAAFVQPDQTIHYPVNEAARFFSELAAGGRFIPTDLFHVLGGMALYQEFAYALAAYLAALAMAFYLRGRGLSPLAQYGAGAAYALMGYNFTLYSAGHFGWFIFLMYGPWAFGLIDRAVRTRKWRYWILLGVALAWASAQQPDIWMMFVLLMAAYGIWCCVREKTFKKILPGAFAALAAMLLTGAPQFYKTLTETVQGREEQIAAASQTPGGEDRWTFCTNWSLPPEDMLEFFIPGIHGASNDPRVSPGNPYTGRLGMQIAPGKWQPYRQHGLYFGRITCLAVIAGLVLFAKRREDRGERIFWLVAAVLCLLLALGRWTPLYRLVYALPYGDSVRCPVKFLHLTEWCAAVLAGFGIDAVLKRFPSKAAFYVVLGIVAVNALDLAAVDRGYFALDPAAPFFRAENAVADFVNKSGGGTVAVLLRPEEGGQLIRESLRDHLVDAPDDFTAAPPRWYLAPLPIAHEAVKSGRYAARGAYAFSLEKGIRATTSPSPRLVLLEERRK